MYLLPKAYYMKLITTLSLILLLSVVGCKKQEITHYEVPKEEAPLLDVPGVNDTASMQQSDANIPTASGELDLTWDVPEPWVTLAASRMRIASFGLDAVPQERFDVSVTRFPGDVGGMLMNVNRWRQQIGLGPVDQGTLNSMIRHYDSEYFHLDIVNLSDPSITMATVVAVLNHEGNSWFFKMTGETHLVSEQFDSFMQLVNTVRRKS